MRKVASLMSYGVNHFGSGGRNSIEFDEFFELFKRSFTYELKKIKAKEIVFSKGHFYLSGFFKLGEQSYYFSISDVRHWIDVRILVRRATSYTDYTGGNNNYVKIESGMAKEIARTFGLRDLYVKPEPKPKKTSQEIADGLMEELKTKKTVSKRIPSFKLANRICWNVGENLGYKSFGITYNKYGRTIVNAKANVGELEYYYNAQSKLMTLGLSTMTDEELIASLSVREVKETVSNFFTGQSCELEPLAVALHDFIKGCEATGSNNNKFHQALNIFREKYPEEYMILLD